MAKRSPSIKDVADAAGVSTATVSNVFSGKKPVKPELAEHVRSIAAGLGYRVNRAASNLRSGDNRLVTVLVPDLSDPFFISLVTEVESRAEADGFDIIIANAKDDPETERRRVATLLSWHPAGVVIVPCSDTMPDQLEASRQTLPIVIADRGADAKGYDTVRIDNADAGAIAANHLLELGHSRILLAASDLRLQAIRERCRGASERVQAAGGKIETVEVGPDPSRGAETLMRWMERNPSPTAIVAVTDMTTLAVLKCLAERKSNVGEDISLVGFDDYPWMSARRTPITAVRQPVKGLADAIWSTLKKRLDGVTGPAEETLLHCGLRVRASTKRVAAPLEGPGARKDISRKDDQGEEAPRNRLN